MVISLVFLERERLEEEGSVGGLLTLAAKKIFFCTVVVQHLCSM